MADAVRSPVMAQQPGSRSLHRRLGIVFVVAAIVFAIAWVSGIATEVYHGRKQLQDHPVPARQAPGPDRPA